VSRPSFEHIHMEMAKLIAQRSTCARLSVGCVIASVDYRKVLAVGYNGGASGQSNDCESTEPGGCGHLHAECNAIINCDSPRSVEKIVFVTDLPCKMCAKMIVNLGNVQKVYYGRDYRSCEGEEILKLAGIEIEKFEGDQ